MAKNILTVDDSITMRTAIKICLEQAGHTVDTAASGHDALGLLSGKSYDLVFTDFNMPEMDGCMLAEKIRGLAYPINRVPIVMVTTEFEDDMKMRGKAAGVNGWVVKPFDPAQLVSIIEKVAK